MSLLTTRWRQDAIGVRPRLRNLVSVYVEPPSLAGRHVRLAVPEPRHLQFLYQLLVDPAVGTRLGFRGGTPSPEAFELFLWEDVLIQFVIASKLSGRPLGLVRAYHASMRDRTVYVSMLSSPRFLSTGLVFEGVGLFVDHLFDVWKMRKVYAETPSHNAAQFSNAFDYVTVEGVLRRHHYYAGEYVDLYLLSISCSEWEALREQFVNDLVMDVHDETRERRG